VGAVNTYTFSNVTTTHRIAAFFAINNYTVAATAGTGGTITPSGNVTVQYGGTQTFTITPNIGYHITGVFVDGVSVGAMSTYTFNNVTANHRIAAFFALNAAAILEPLLTAEGWEGPSVQAVLLSTVMQPYQVVQSRRNEKRNIVDRS
jgi:hypothetical protein